MVNIKLEKKEYVAPVMTILDMGSKAAFLSCSGGVQINTTLGHCLVAEQCSDKEDCQHE